MSKKKKKHSGAKQSAPREKAWKLPLICYIVALGLYLLGCTYSFVQDTSRIYSGAIVRQAYKLEDLALESIEQLADENGMQRFVSTDDDPKILYYSLQGTYITRVGFNATSNKPGGEMVLYYTTSSAQGLKFTDRQKVWAQQYADGSWYFDLGGKKVYGLRLDPDTTGGVVWTVKELMFNAPKPFGAYYAPNAQPMFLLLLLPGLAAAGIQEGRRIWRLAKAAR